MTPSKDISRLIEIMAALRDPGSGCPWDIKQTFVTIAPYTIEEAYEVADAIARGDLEHLKDELGDLLLQVVYHARMAEERQAFAFADVVEAITSKMIRRHPHVFGTEAERAAGAEPGFWDRAKGAEKTADAEAGLLGDVPVGLPALTRAIKLQNKAAKFGFDWPSLAPVLAKLEEELAELEEAIASAPKGAAASPAIEEEFGDLL
ncbi:MAG: nucleoside triphosphate pyrophosphohydrolase, partial [Hyphomicrobium sp.]